jgi:2-oxoglutarate dehydrogenase E1 component
MNFWREFQGPNAGYILELYERYQNDPNSVDAATRDLFARGLPPLNGHSAPAVTSGSVSAALVDKIVSVAKVARAIRGYGHLAAHLDPLESPPHGDPTLELSTYGLSEDDLRGLPASIVGSPIADRTTNALEAIAELRRVYSSTTGYDYDHIHIPEERDWLRAAVEGGTFRPPQMPIDSKALLERLTQVETFELFLHRSFPGKTRFSIEGLDVMIPMLDEVVDQAGDVGIRSILIGMAHRGRLNVLAHTLNKPYVQILAEFKDPLRTRSRADAALGWTGDVKYHLGANRDIDFVETPEPVDLEITLAPNPSHLEAVNPVVEGMARATATTANQPGMVKDNPGSILPILIHGDAAFPGQGVVAETLTFYRVPGYRTGGTLHIIANNQLGYTTNPAQTRSTLYASDLAKGFEVPVVHVNADDPQACIEAARLACAYRARFRKDFLIDLIGYRRYGHNEGDEPAFTQPKMYQLIDKHPTVRALLAQRLVAQGIVAAGWPEAIVQERMSALQTMLEGLKPEESLVEVQPAPPPAGAARKVKTTVSADRLRALNDAMLALPEGFTPHPKLEKSLERRRQALADLNQPTIDWATAEHLALASILEDGTPIRLTGEDAERGTFSHRHVALHDYKTGRTIIPLQTIPQAKAAFEVRNSPLSEYAAIGFEYGYSIQAPERLVIWEAQYGDFINGAQTVIDEFLVSARAKWGQTPSLVLLLPHAYEGQGPDHSSGRLERFLNMAADTNLRVANCTTAAQYFHLLRRQAELLKVDPLPLIVMTPKSLLRHPNVASPLQDLVKGRWQPVIDDARAKQNPKDIRRLILCSGKVYVDLVTNPAREKNQAVAIVRVEQLYPFRPAEFEPVLAGYPNLEDVAWGQEEPENMGAWEFLRPNLTEVIHNRWPLKYIGRPRSSSPAEGSAARHAVTQKLLIEQAYKL